VRVLTQQRILRTHVKSKEISMRVKTNMSHPKINNYLKGFLILNNVPKIIKCMEV
jgi:hypothetical protein